MPLPTPGEFLARYTPPAATPTADASAAASSPNAPALTDPRAFLAGYAPKGAQESAAETPAPPMSTMEYIGRRALRGALNFAAEAAPGELQVEQPPFWWLPEGAGPIGEQPSQEFVNQKAGLPPGTPVPTNPIARYGGAVAEAATGNPLFTVAMPATTALSALGSQAGSDLTGGSTWGEVLGGLAGGGVTSIGKLAYDALIGAGTLGKVIDSLGGGTTLASAASRIQDWGKQWLSTAPESIAGSLLNGQTKAAQEARAWAPLDAAMHQEPIPSTPGGAADISIPASPGMPFGPPTPINTLAERIAELLRPAKAGVLQEAHKAFLPRELSGLEESLQQAGVIKGPMLEILNRAEPIVPYWDNVRTLVSDIGEAIHNPGSAMKSLGDKTLSALYEAGMKDLEARARESGVGDLFDNARKTSKTLNDLKTNVIAPLTEPGTTPETALTKLMAGTTKGGTKLQALRDAGAGPVLDELAAAHLAQTPSSWLKLSPEAKRALVPDGALRDKIDTAVAALKSHPQFWKAATSEGLGLFGGETVGTVLNHLAPGLGITADTGRLVGALVPPAWYLGKQILTHPNALMRPAVGAAVGANELSP